MPPSTADCGSKHNAMRSIRQVLMLDADDTLWENNIYFDQAIDRFVDLVNHPILSPTEVRNAFNAFESARVKVYGYGTDAFHASLLAGFQHLTGAACDERRKQHIAQYAASVLGAEMTLLEGVAETLPLLAARHTLILVTKGCPTEQTAKLERSGLQHHFTHVEILREKDANGYRELLERYGCDPAHTWMIGNSPRSDINPALEAGLHTAYLPHYSTWVLEQEALQRPAAHQKMLHLVSFRDLLDHFA